MEIANRRKINIATPFILNKTFLLSDGCSIIHFFYFLVAESLASYKKIYFEVKGYVWSTVSYTVSQLLV